MDAPASRSTEHWSTGRCKDALEFAWFSYEQLRKPVNRRARTWHFAIGFGLSRGVRPGGNRGRID
jgi:hypothetical protein